MKRVADWACALFIVVGTTAVLNAQTTQPPYPPLIHTLNVVQNDSSLVRTAKETVAARRGGKAAVMIDDQYLTRALGGVRSVASEPDLPSLAPKSDARQVNTLNVAKQTVDPAETRKKIESLKVERERMAAEDLEPYGGDVEEDNVTRRMTQSSTQLQQMQSQPPSPPPPQP